MSLKSTNIVQFQFFHLTNEFYRVQRFKSSYACVSVFLVAIQKLFHLISSIKVQAKLCLLDLMILYEIYALYI